MKNRNRADGWQHAKLSGHDNETALRDQIINNSSYQDFFLNAIGKQKNKISKVDVGGLFEKNVDCVFDNESTKSKTDMQVFLDNGEKYNISVKKSSGGQVFLITIERFINGFEMQFNEEIPSDVKRAIQLFWGSAPDIDEIINVHGKNRLYETRKHRLVAETIKSYNPLLYETLLSWFAENTKELIDFCFSKGLAKNDADFADYLWYKNEIGENDFNDLVMIEELKKSTEKIFRDKTSYGNSGGGTTIQLPFGFVQWHSPTKSIPGSIQFHHNYNKIKEIIENIDS